MFTTLIERINDHDAQVRIAVMWAIDHADFGAGYHVPKALSIALEDDSAEIRARPPRLWATPASGSIRSSRRSFAMPSTTLIMR